MKKTKTCNTCKKKLSISNFSKKLDRRKDGKVYIHPRCKPCGRKVARDFAAHKRKFLLAYAQNKGCADCGERNPVVLDFDHVRGVKKDHVSAMAHLATSLATIMEEVEKCEVRCANCHRIKTAKQRNYYKDIDLTTLDRVNLNILIGPYQKRYFTLTANQVLAIRSKYPTLSVKQLAAEYKVKICTIYKIIKGRTWKHLLSATAPIVEIPLRCGENINTAKLSERQVKDIKKEYATNTTSFGKLGKKYNVSPGTIRHIIRGDTWKHLVEAKPVSTECAA